MENSYYGLADCHGLESFVLMQNSLAVELFLDPEEKNQSKHQQFALCLRAQANQQRHAVVYMAKLRDEDSLKIEDLIENKQFIEALNMLKASALEIQLGTYGTTLPAAKKNWNMIPNPDLDPYHQ